ncbi:unnamed protein product [Prunus brigantina]
MKSLPLQWVCSSNQAKVTAMVHKSAVARMWTYIGILRVDKIARMGKSTTLEKGVKFCDAIEKSTPRDLQRLLQKAEARDFPSMIGSIDCMH